MSKYDWHDLSKNPNDLPKIDEKVLACGVHHGYEVIAFRGARTLNLNNKVISMWDWKKNTMKEIIAWKYIEPFGGK